MKMHVYHFSIFAVFLFIIGCEEKVEKPDTTSFSEKQTCVGCHTNAGQLAELAPGLDEPPSSSGGG